MPLEVPAQVHNLPYSHNEVQVAPGTNWDFARSALVTEIAPLPDPVPVIAPIVSAPAAAIAPVVVEDGVPAGTPSLTLLFSNNNAVVGKAHRDELRALPKTHPWTVIAHADKTETDPLRFAKARARAVTTLLRDSGHKVTFVKASTVALPEPGAVMPVFKNRSVDVYATPLKGD
jgi:hypothetical protein